AYRGEGTSFMTNDPPSSRLDYAQRSPLARRRFWRRIKISILVILVIAAVALLGPIGWHQALVLYWQKKCLDYTDAPDHIVTKSDADPAGHIAEPWQRFHDLLDSSHFYSNGTLFAHERTSPRGLKRLVCIDMPPIFLYLSGLEIYFVVHVY